MIPIDSGRTRAAKGVAVRLPMVAKRCKRDFLRQVLLARASEPAMNVAHAHDCLRKLHTLPRREIGILGFNLRQEIGRDVAYAGVPAGSTRRAAIDQPSIALCMSHAYRPIRHLVSRLLK